MFQPKGTNGTWISTKENESILPFKKLKLLRSFIDINSPCSTFDLGEYYKREDVAKANVER
ncbi:hypothetical protein N7490_000550 [Penicillium lividum]|nr:hypothetical protein N7490_000550 [Penicillium lividum]